MEKNRKKEPDESTYFEMGQFYFLNAKYDEAINEFKKALKLSPNDAEIYYHLGLAYESINNIDEAIKMYQRALEIDPHHKSSRQHLEKIIQR